MKLPRKVQIVEVGMRDGLQNETQIVPTQDKIAWIQQLVACGIRQIEVGAFVRPDRVPAMADTAAVLEGIRRKRDVRYLALVPNQRGLERAVDVDAPAIAVFTGASNTFTRKNMNMTIEESLEQAELVVRAARAQKRMVRGYISTCWECPYEGPVKPAAVVKVVKALLKMKCYEIVISDTIGTAAPKEVHALLQRVLKLAPAARFALHMHDTRGMAVANILTAAQLGISTFDASIGGLGGCPYAPGASGNVDTADVAYLFERMGVSTGIDLAALHDIRQVILRRFSRG